MKITRQQVIAYRVAAQQLDRSAATVRGLAVLAIGVQDAAGDVARLAFDARLPKTPPAELVGPDRPLALVWSLRGAPHVHKRADLDALAAALYPLSEADARGRLNETGPSVQRAGISALDQYATAARELRTAVRSPTGKGAVSTAVSKRLPDVMLRDCRTCKAKHISDSAMRAASLSVALELQPDTAPPVLQRRTGGKVVSTGSVAQLRKLVTAYLTLLGPATPAQVADYYAVRRADLETAWPDDVIEVELGRGTAFLPSKLRAALEHPPEPDVVRLLSGFDPYLQARDRSVIVPDASVHKALWPVLGRPGAVFVDGEVAGTWRPKASGAKLVIAVEEFAPIPKPKWEQVEAEAERVAAVRGLGLTRVTRT